jgi:hypothetical protein
MENVGPIRFWNASPLFTDSSDENRNKKKKLCMLARSGEMPQKLPSI